MPRSRAPLTLPVVVGGAAEDGGLRAVWPIRDDDERAALAATAALFGGTLVAGAAPRPIERRDEIVAALAPLDDTGADEIVALAHLYAALTGRRAERRGSVAALADGALPSVVVTTSRWAGAELFAALADRADASGDPLPGVLAAPTPAELRRQVLVRSAALYLAGVARATGSRAMLVPSLPGARHTVSGPIILGGAAEPGEIGATLTGGSDVVAILTHSDGLDAMARPGLTFCPMTPDAADRAGPAPHCWATGHCFRAERTIEDAWQAGVLFDVGRIRGRVVVWDSCFGAADPLGATPASWNLIARLLASPTVGAIATRWDMSVASVGGLDSVAAALAGGAAVGAVLTATHRQPTAIRAGQRYCLFGDPALTIGRTTAPSIAETPTATPPAPATTPATASSTSSVDDGELRFHAGWLAAGGTTGPLGPLRVAAASAASAALATGAVTPALREALVAYCLQRANTFVDWFRLAPTTRAERAACACGAPARSIVADLAPLGARPRRIDDCPRCRVTADVPTGCDLALVVEDDRVLHVTGALPRGPWAGAVRFFTHGPGTGEVRPWPADRDGAPVRRLELAQPWARWPHQIHLCLVDDTYRMLGQQIPYARRTGATARMS